MPTVTLSRYECSADLVPAVCAVCGEPGAERLAHTFSWRPAGRGAGGGAAGAHVPVGAVGGGGRGPGRLVAPPDGARPPAAVSGARPPPAPEEPVCDPHAPPNVGPDGGRAGTAAWPFPGARAGR